MLTELDKAMLEVEVEQVTEYGCLLCRGRPDVVGMWFPSPEAIADLYPPGSQKRAIMYAICPRCRALPGVHERIEATIIGRIHPA